MVSWPDCWFADQLIVRAGGLSTDSSMTVISGHSGVGKTTLLRLSFGDVSADFSLLRLGGVSLLLRVRALFLGDL